MKFLFLLGLLFYQFTSYAYVNSPSNPDEGVLGKDFDSFYDPKFDYSHFPARVTDKTKNAEIIKITSENHNVRFFKAGDNLKFVVPRVKMIEECEGNIRGVEDQYVIVYINNLDQCWGRKRYFRRGTMLKIISKDLAKRVYEATIFRKTLIGRKSGFLNQLNKINHFLWSYEQLRAQRAAEYDQQVVAILKEKEQALDDLLSKKKDHIRLQAELVERLDDIEHNIKHYRVTRPEILADRWEDDHDLGKPVGDRPQEVKSKLDRRKHRWIDKNFK